jgi:hypothetical protein
MQLHKSLRTIKGGTSSFLEGKFWAAFHASEAAAVKKRVVLERPDFVRRVDRLPAPEAVAVHVVRLEHDVGRILEG